MAFHTDTHSKDTNFSDSAADIWVKWNPGCRKRRRLEISPLREGERKRLVEEISSTQKSELNSFLFILW